MLYHVNDFVTGHHGMETSRQVGLSRQALRNSEDGVLRRFSCRLRSTLKSSFSIQIWLPAPSMTCTQTQPPHHFFIMSKVDVLIVGSGPTGLALAISLTQQGVKVRIIDKEVNKPPTSRAIAVHARVLELYDQLDLSEPVIAAGHKMGETELWCEGRRKAHFSMQKVGEDISPYPFVLVYPQYKHEQLLEKRLKEMGVWVERGWEFVDHTDHGSHVTARLRETTAEEGVLVPCDATFMVGCDGARSKVRSSCGIGFEGETYPNVFFVADVIGTGQGAGGDMHACYHRSGVYLLWPHGDGRVHLVGSLSEGSDTMKDNVMTLEGMAPTLTQETDLKVDEVTWLTTYQVHHRLAESFRSGQVFLAGDAVHAHSPVGGYGMNGGILDAINLAWKLASVIHGKADACLLDSYDVERRRIAEMVLHTTDRAFRLVSSQGWFYRFFRLWVVPIIGWIIVRIPMMTRRAFFLFSQIHMNYRQSPLSAGTAGVVHGGDRLPYVVVNGHSNFDGLEAIHWQVHVYGEVKEQLTEWCQSRGIPLQVFPWSQEYRRVRLGRNAAYLLRPDTYVAVAEPSGQPDRLDRFVVDNGLSFQ